MLLASAKELQAQDVANEQECGDVKAEGQQVANHADCFSLDFLRNGFGRAGKPEIEAVVNQSSPWGCDPARYAIRGSPIGLGEEAG